MATLRLLLAALALAVGPMAFAQQLLYIHADHLNAPRLVTNGSGVAVWRWDQTEPFGDNLPDEDPDGNGTPGHMPLRFPGQYFDKETNTHYNMARDYDPAIGRYIQSDPIGLRGGIDTYAYVLGDPLRYVDPEGKAGMVVLYCVAGGLIGLTAYSLWSSFSCQDKCERDCEAKHKCAPETGCPHSEGDTRPLLACKRVCTAQCHLGMGNKGPTGPTPSNTPPNTPPMIPKSVRATLP